MTITKNVSNYNDVSLDNRASSEFFRRLFFLCFIGAICHAEFISASRFRNKFAVTGRQEEILKQVQDDRSHTDWFDKLTNRVKYFKSEKELPPQACPRKGEVIGEGNLRTSQL